MFCRLSENLSCPLISALSPIHLDLHSILQYQNVFLHAGHTTVGKEFFVPVDALSRGGDNLNNQMGLSTHIWVAAGGIARHHNIRIVVHRWINDNFHVSDEHFTWPTV